MITQRVQQSSSLKPNNRLGNRKSRTGCITCKARRVKCDEAKPHCRRCANARRSCEGYEDQTVVNGLSSQVTTFSKSQRASFCTALVSEPHVSDLSGAEVRALQFYQERIASVLGGAVDSCFWTEFTLQLSYTEPAIRHALVAVSSFYEDKALLCGTNDIELRQVSLSSYSKSLSLTTERISRENANIISLTSCVLFLCLEFLQGHDEQAKILVRHGYDILKRALQTSTSSEKDMIRRTILPIYERLLVLGRLFGQTMPALRQVDTTSITGLDRGVAHFEHLVEARDVLYGLIPHGHDFIQKARQYRQGTEIAEPVLSMWIAEQRQHLDMYANWLIALEACIRLQNGTTAKYKKEIAQLRLTHAIMVAWISCCLERTELMYGNITPLFETCLENADIVLSDNDVSQHTESPLFTFEMSVIPPLYFVALKCRDLRLRQKALVLLRRAPEREGLWHRDHALRVVRRVIELETGGFKVLRIDSILLGGEKFQDWKDDARVCDVMQFSSTEEGTFVTLCAQRGQDDQEWVVWHEFVPP